MFIAVVLHTFWDLSASFAVILTYITSEAPVAWTNFSQATIPCITLAQLHFKTLYTALRLAINALVGVLLVRYMWKKGVGSETPPNSTSASVVA